MIQSPVPLPPPPPPPTPPHTQCVLEPACKAFAQFLKLYPYCYGYWKKYSDLVKKLCGDEKAQEVLEEGVAAIPLSVGPVVALHNLRHLLL